MSAAASRPLASIVGRRIVLFALIAMAAQFVVTFWRYASEPDHLATLLLTREADELAQGLSRDGKSYVLPGSLEARYGAANSGYQARIRSTDGEILFSNCGECRSLPKFDPDHSFWINWSGSGFPLSLSGGVVTDEGPARAMVELVIDRDPQHAVWRVFADELVEAMVVPMSITLLFVLGATLLSIRTALAPVRRAAEAAGKLDPLRPDTTISTKGMPLEVAQLAGAVDRSFARVRELVAAQKLFTSAIAHEIRTPLSIIRLELERIEHPRARRAIDELDELARFVGQLTALARLEAADRRGFTDIVLDEMLQDVVGSLAPWVYERGAKIAAEPRSGAVVSGNEPLLKDAVRNLIENAARHGGDGVSITVRGTEGPSVEVVDDGSGHATAFDGSTAPTHYRRDGGIGIGLEIVRRIAALHGARFDIGSNATGGVAARIDFGATA